LLRLDGRFESHPKYGKQFKVLDFEILRGPDVVAIERYLASREVRGVGARLARRIAQHFGQDLPNVLEKEPHRLREVPGLGQVVIARIEAAWQDVSGLRELTVFLRGHGVAAAHARKI